ncbi:hypothetical protein M514_18046, partial [Trichuris suis]
MLLIFTFQNGVEILANKRKRVELRLREQQGVASSPPCTSTAMAISFASRFQSAMMETRNEKSRARLDRARVTRQQKKIMESGMSEPRNDRN